MAGHVVKVSVVADTKKFSRAFRGLANETGLSNLASAGKKAASVLATVGAAATTALGAVGVKAVTAAADLEQSTGAIEAVFKDAAGTMKSWAASAATAVGLTKNEYQELAVVLGSQLKNAGVPMDQIAGKTNDLVGLGADLAAMFGGTTAEAVGALSSALKGERDPIERYGVSLKQAAIDAKAAELGFQKVGGSFDAEAQAAATLALVMEQTTDAHGAFAREGGTLANQVQVLKAQLGNLAADAGGLLLPAATKVATFLNERFTPSVSTLKTWVSDQLIPRLRELAAIFSSEVAPRLQQAAEVFTSTILPAIREFLAWIGQKAPPIIQGFSAFFREWGPALGAAAATIAVLVAGFMAFQKVIAIITAVKVAVATLNLVLAANPIVLVVMAIAALVAGLVILWQRCEGFRTAVQAVWAAVLTAAQPVIDWFTATLLPAMSALWTELVALFQAAWAKAQELWNTYGQPLAALIISIWQGVAANWSTIWEGIKTAFSGVWQIISTIVTTALGIIRGVIQVVTGVIKGDWSAVWNGIKTIASSVWNGIKGVVTGAINVVRGIITAALGVIKGVWTGAWNGIKTTLSNAWNSIKTSVSNGVSNAVSTIRSLPSKARSALSNIGSTLLNAGKNLIQGFINGIKSKINSVKDTLTSLTSSLTSWKGPETKDKTLLTAPGKHVINGFIRGLESRYSAVRASLHGLTRDVASTNMGTITAPTVSSPAAGSATTPVSITVNVQSLVPTVETGRIIAEALATHELFNGAGRGMRLA